MIYLACSQRPVSRQSLLDVVSYPNPPDTARIQYLTSFGSSENIEKKRGFLTRYLVGEEEPKNIYKPYGVAAIEGKIFICDLSIQGLEILDLKSKKFEYFIPSGLGKLNLPLNCSIDSAGNLYVADVGRRQIVVFNKYLEYSTSFGFLENFRPTDVFVTDDRVWVTNMTKGSIDVFNKDSTHAFLHSLPDKDTKEGKLFKPTNLFVTSNKLYVSDLGEAKIQIYDHKGNFHSSVGSYGRNIGQFVRPKGIAVDKDDNLYVADAAFENVQIFNKEDQLMMFFGGGTGESGGMLLPAKVFISYDNNSFFQKYVFRGYDLKYIILVTNNYGPNKVSVYGRVEVKAKSKN